MLCLLRTSGPDKDQAELKDGAAKYVEKIRKEEEKRFERVTNR
jgi:hypothetical protein